MWDKERKVHAYIEEEPDPEDPGDPERWITLRIEELAKKAGYPSQWDVPPSEWRKMETQAALDWEKLPEETRTAWLKSESPTLS